MIDKTTIFLAVVFCGLTGLAIGLDFFYPEGLNSAPIIEQQTVRDGSPYRSNRLRSYHFGK